MDEKTKKVEDLEAEIASTIEGQARENQELKERLNLQHALAEAYRDAEMLLSS